MKNYLRSFAAFVIASTVITGSQAQTTPRPSFKVGDTWTVVRNDPYSKVVRSTQEQSVSNISDQQIVLTVTGGTATMTPDLTFLDSPNIQNDTGYQLLRFPLEAGKKWDFKTNWKNKQSGRSGSTSLDVEVVGPEKYSGPAGSFDSIKVQAKGNFYAGGGSWQVKLTYWYVPELKRIVRTEWRDHKKDIDYDEEIAAYKLAE